MDEEHRRSLTACHMVQRDPVDPCSSMTERLEEASFVSYLRPCFRHRIRGEHEGG
jgi:hypothetical protein